jgi:uncharacterized membrane protein (DUF373 family)
LHFARALYAFLHQGSQEAVQMRIFFVFMMLECLEAFLQICAYRRWDVVVDARFICDVFVVVVVREVRDLARTLYGS